MQKSFLAFPKTGLLPPLIADYISGKQSIRELYSYTPEINSFGQAITGKQREEIDRDVLAGELHRQYELIFKEGDDQSSGVKNNINSLKQPNTFTVTTGHQLNIFTGPLFFLYKIITTINLCELLKNKYPAYNFVPVYWMASEDHDFEEINHIHLFGKKIIWNTQQNGACGKFSTESVKSVLNELKNILGDTDNAKSIVNLFDKAYLQHNTLAEATRYLVHALFAKYGLVIVDGDSKALKELFKDIMKDDLLNHSAFQNVTKTISAIEEDYKVQVNPREINLFYLDNGVRERIVKDGAEYKVQNTSFTFSQDEIITELNNSPEKFSPNVVLRPLYEEKILPNLAYIGGPGELSYWLELKAMFDFYKVNFPVVALRCMALVIDESSQNKLQKLQLTPAHFFLPEDELIKSFILENSGDNLLLAQEADQLNELFESIKKKAAAVDQSLLASVDAEKQKINNSLTQLEQKLTRAEKKKQEVGIAHVKKVRDKIFPSGTFQERFENIISFYLKYGTDFIDLLKNNLTPFENELLVLNEETIKSN